MSNKVKIYEETMCEREEDGGGGAKAGDEVVKQNLTALDRTNF